MLAIFSITLYNTISSFGFLREDLSFKPWDETSNILADIIINPRHHRRDLLALIATIAINIPLLIKVLVFAIKEFASLYLMVPLFIVGPILYLALIFSTSNKYEFSNYDDEYYLCTVTKKEGFLHFIKRFVLINSILALIGYIVYLMFTVGDDAFAHEVRHINGRDIHLVSIIVFIALNIVVVYITVLRIKLSSLRQKLSTQIYDRRNSRRIA
ncbi:MAG: hypothetical protein K6G28_02750 [Acholeplasmatales bacterium]|nr:hypothetical protein [Acholeplasmatales bacterium]